MFALFGSRSSAAESVAGLSEFDETAAPLSGDCGSVVSEGVGVEAV